VEDNVCAMLGKLTRIVLAFATALIFTGQVEAATKHCVRLAHAAEASAVQPKINAPPCHDTQQTRTSEPSQSSKNDPHEDRCECIAVLCECTPVITPAGSSLIEPYAWAAPQAETFASNEPAPALRPPRG
jgi:hypothetical protein